METNKFFLDSNRNIYFHNRPFVEDLIIDAREHKILKKFKKTLETRHNVLICMPNTKSLDSDIVFVSIQGELSDRDEVKKFLEKMANPSNVESQDYGSDDDVVILSDNESESSKEIELIDLSDEETPESVKKSAVEGTQNNEPVSIIDSPCSTNIQIKKPPDEDTHESVKISTLEDSLEPVCIIDNPSCSTSSQIKNLSNENTLNSVKKSTFEVSQNNEPVCIIDDPSSTKIQSKNLSAEKNSESAKKLTFEDSHDNEFKCIIDSPSCSANIQIQNSIGSQQLKCMKRKKKRKKKKKTNILLWNNASSSSENKSANFCDVKKLTFEDSNNNESICIIDSPCSSNIQIENSNSSQQLKGTKRKKTTTNMVVRCDDTSSSSENKASDLSDVTSTTNDNAVNHVLSPHQPVSKKAKLSDSVLIIEEFAPSNTPVIDFLPLPSSQKPVNQRNEHINFSLVNTNKANNDDIVILDETVHRPKRPIVIDGSNVAFEHGKVTHTFSIKGIKLAIDYFLKRGHEQVTAFIPKYRKNQNPNRAVPTTDFDILIELEKKQQIVFTPSRVVNGRHIASYDDRFIVHLAATNGGVIVSNDNYRDIINESQSFKEAIEQRLLMYCFVGDLFMVPDDPLGRNGPKLNEFLSFP